MDNYKAIKFPLTTEKGIRIMEAENKLVFMVDNKATKADIKTAVEQLFKVKVAKVSTFMTNRSKKKAYVKLMPQTPAIEVATQLGLM